jgi:hypothetical protein
MIFMMECQFPYIMDVISQSKASGAKYVQIKGQSEIDFNDSDSKIARQNGMAYRGMQKLVYG